MKDRLLAEKMEKLQKAQDEEDESGSEDEDDQTMGDVDIEKSTGLQV